MTEITIPGPVVLVLVFWMAVGCAETIRWLWKTARYAYVLWKVEL